MSHLMISDLSTSRELDRKAMTAICGGKNGGVNVNDSFLFGSSIVNNFVDVDVNTWTNVKQIANVNVNVNSAFGAMASSFVGLDQSVGAFPAPAVPTFA